MSIQRNDWSLQRKGIIDQERHKERVKEAIKKNLGSIVSNEAIILSDGKRTVKVPIRALDEYKFRFDYRKRKHVGQGDGKTRVGDVIAREGQPGQGQGSGQAGQDAGGEYYEAEVNIDEIAALIFEDLQLPFLEEKAKKAVQAKTTQFNEIRRTGVMANLDKRRMILENIKRNAREEGRARFGNVRKEDLRFKTWEESLRYESNAVVLSLMDVSGSMGEFKKYIARSFFFWMVRFLRTKYDNVEIVFISHHTEAREVTRGAVLHAGRVGRDGRLKRLPVGPGHHQHALQPARLEHLPVPLLRRRQLLLRQRGGRAPRGPVDRDVQSFRLRRNRRGGGQQLPPLFGRAALHLQRPAEEQGALRRRPH